MSKKHSYITLDDIRQYPKTKEDSYKQSTPSPSVQEIIDTAKENIRNQASFADLRVDIIKLIRIIEGEQIVQNPDKEVDVMTMHYMSERSSTVLNPRARPEVPEPELLVQPKQQKYPLRTRIFHDVNTLLNFVNNDPTIHLVDISKYRSTYRIFYQIIN